MIFEGNESSGTSSVGGAIVVSSVAIEVGGSIIFSNNIATGTIYSSGGAINASSFIIRAGEDIIFEGNKVICNSGATGGAIHAVGSLSFSVVEAGKNITFSNNTAGNGGAIYASDSLSFTINAGGDIIFTNNIATTSGGAIYANNLSTYSYVKLISNSIIASGNTPNNTAGSSTASKDRILFETVDGSKM